MGGNALKGFVERKNKELGKVFNGNTVSSLTGLTGKDLGEFMKFCKSDFRHDGRVLYDVNEWVNFKLKKWKENVAKQRHT